MCINVNLRAGKIALPRASVLRLTSSDSSSHMSCLELDPAECQSLACRLHSLRWFQMICFWSPCVSAGGLDSKNPFRKVWSLQRRLLGVASERLTCCHASGLIKGKPRLQLAQLSGGSGFGLGLLRLCQGVGGSWNALGHVPVWRPTNALFSVGPGGP